MSSVEAFLRLSETVPPPDDPVRAFGDWKRFTSVNGFPPPEDYRMLIREYGAGTFAGSVRLIEPFNPGWSFMDKAKEVLRRFQGPTSTLWPDAGGFLPWAVTTDGGLIGWRTGGRPDSWTTSFWSHDGKDSAELDVSATGFILGLVEGGSAGSGGNSGGAGSRSVFFVPATD